MSVRGEVFSPVAEFDAVDPGGASTGGSAMDPSRFTVYVVEDDADARRGMLDVVGAMSLRPVGLESAEAFLQTYGGAPAVLICDIRMPGMSGLDLQTKLLDRGLFVPMVVVTGFPRVRHVVEAVKNGAITVLEKPFTSDDLWLALREALTVYEAGIAQHRAMVEARRRYASLSAQERRVVGLMLDNRTNKMIAKELDVSVRTVEARRRKILDKMNAHSIVELVRFVDLADQGKG